MKPTRDESKLPQWAQRELSRLRNNLASAERKLAEGPENSTVFVDPYAADPRPLGTNPTIEFQMPGAERGYIQVRRIEDSDGLRIMAADQAAAGAIDIEELDAARRDPRVHDFLGRAADYGARVEESAPGAFGDTARRVESESSAALIDVDELQAARRDPRVRRFLTRAADYGARLGLIIEPQASNVVNVYSRRLR